MTLAQFTASTVLCTVNSYNLLINCSKHVTASGGINIFQLTGIPGSPEMPFWPGYPGIPLGP